jgi:anaerobic magnesium-protoporphyrin IX monomethyl ester cyclase
LRVLLVNPRFDGGAEVPPLGLLCLASVLIGSGVETRVIDLDVPGLNDPHNSLRTAMAESCPSVLGVTSTSRNYDAAVWAVSCAREFSPDIVTVLGGIHATLAGDGILESVPALDFLVRGEGEHPFLELVRSLAGKKDHRGIEGLSFRSIGGIVHNPRGTPASLDGLPAPAHELVPNANYRARGISSSRGCVHSCSFCSIREMYGKGDRSRAVPRVIEEIFHLTTLGARRIMFTDDNFTSDRTRLRELCGAMIKTGLAGRAEYITEGRLDDIARHPLSAQILGEAGFRYVYAGAESASQSVLDFYGKKTTPDEVFAGAMHCINSNVMPVVNFIMFGPRDSVRTIRETIAFARRLFEYGAQIAYTETAVPYPGTRLRAHLEKEGRLREKGGVSWFVSEVRPGYEEFLSLFAAARKEAHGRFGQRPLFEQQRVYFELGCLDEILSGYPE